MIRVEVVGGAEDHIATEQIRNQLNDCSVYKKIYILPRKCIITKVIRLEQNKNFHTKLCAFR